MKIFSKIFFYTFVVLVLLLTVRGVAGNPSEKNINTSYWKENGPFELSPERGRFALTYSYVENDSFEFSLPIARFATPDLGYINGKYVSLFAPGVSFFTIPGYKLGKALGISQVGTFAVISFFALLNSILIYLIAKKLGAKKTYSYLASLAFLFATPAFTYAVSLYQHHISVFLLLTAIYILLRFKGLIALWIVWFLVAVSITVDYPNFFLMIPVAIFAVLRTFALEDHNYFFKIKINFARVVAVLGTVFPLLFFGWVNTESYGNPFQLSGTVTNVKLIDAQGLPHKDYLSGENESSEPDSGALRFFNSRNISNGLYVHLVSPDRGILFFAPFLIFSILGASILYREKPYEFSLLIAVVSVNLILYSMWGDPWGGWAFGSRYLIPMYAIGTIFLGISLEKIFQTRFLKIAFITLLSFSIFVNTLGAVTTSANPPQVEIAGLEKISGKEEKYTFERNWEYLNTNGTKSFFYQQYLRDLITPMEFYLLISLGIIMIFYGVSSWEYWKNILTKKADAILETVSTERWGDKLWKV